MKNKQNESFGLRFLYHTPPGRAALKLLASKGVSVIGGKCMDSKLSRVLIKKFVKKNSINLDEYEKSSYESFNDFFTRKIKPELRPISFDVNDLISPCDGLLSAYKINRGTVLPVKQSYYSIASLLENKRLAKKFENGICLVFRLCVNHYHRYCYFDSGHKSKNIHIEGKLHTVRPIALEKYPVFIQNSREYTVMKTDNFGIAVQIEVGALLVGRISNNDEEADFVRGAEKGKFLYGGSTVILLLQEGCAHIEERLFSDTSKGIETPVKMGQTLGRKI